nr:histone-lysine N-methyltransferase SETMAR-like [Hydra vulgaris]
MSLAELELASNLGPLVYGNQAPKYSIVAKWATLFKDGRESLEDDPRSGHPKTTYTADNIEQVKLTSRWINHELTDENQKYRVEACTENLALFRNGPWRLCDIVTGDESWFYLRQVGHKCCSFGYVEKGDTITSEYHIKSCLKPLICELNKQKPKTGTHNFKFLYDNVRPHVTQTVTNCLNQGGITIIRHSPYSPDLAPSDYWLFDLIKNDHDTDDDDTDVRKPKKPHNEAT